MTTPENFRRRQRIEGVTLLLLGVWVAFWTYHSSQVQDQIVHCLRVKVEGLANAAGTRADLTDRETTATKKVLLGVRGVKDEAAFNQLLNNYNAEIEDIQHVREKTPVPPFPNGSCEEQ